jgi:hypothetical protein
MSYHYFNLASQNTWEEERDSVCGGAVQERVIGKREGNLIKVHHTHA